MGISEHLAFILEQVVMVSISKSELPGLGSAGVLMICMKISGVRGPKSRRWPPSPSQAWV